MSLGQEVRRHQLVQYQLWIKILIGVYVVSFALGGIIFIRRHWHRRGPASTTAAPAASAASADATANVALVDGVSITRDDVDTALEVIHGPAMIDRLVKETAIIQAAQRADLTLDDPDSQQALVKLSESTHDPGLFSVREKSLRSELLLRKLVLRDVPDSLRHKIYDTFKTELTQYEVFDILVSNEAEAHKTMAALRQGQPFDKVAARVSRDPRTRKQGGRIGFMTLARIEDLLGTAGAQAVQEQVREHKIGAPVQAQYGLVIVKVGKVLNRYVDLKPAIDAMIAHSKQRLAIYQLSHDVEVRYPILEANRKLVQTHRVGASASPGAASASPKPSAATRHH